MGNNTLWLGWSDDVAAAQRAAIVSLCEAADVKPQEGVPAARGYAVYAFSECSQEVITRIVELSRTTSVLAIALGRLESAQTWALLRAGAMDVLAWPRMPENAAQITSRWKRFCELRELVESARVHQVLVGDSPAWCKLIWGLAEAAAFTQIPVLVLGESGTGKELIAQLVHDLDRRPHKRELVVVDCTTLRPELCGSELFGHERGAFTGALQSRDGACAQAHGGTLFLDEIGELPLELQAQLLRVIQEQKYKRIGNNSWQATQFRLVCATHRDLLQGVARGTFREDLYHRIAGGVFRAPPLRERRSDILPLATHFLSQVGLQSNYELDDSVREYLLMREYPGNVRDLRRVVTRLAHRHVGPGPITLGSVPPEEWPAGAPDAGVWQDDGFERALRHAISLGVGLREIGQAVADTTIRLALDLADGNLQRAASHLGVTDRALQLRRATRKAGV